MWILSGFQVQLKMINSNEFKRKSFSGKRKELILFNFLSLSFLVSTIYKSTSNKKNDKTKKYLVAKEEKHRNVSLINLTTRKK